MNNKELYSTLMISDEAGMAHNQVLKKLRVLKGEWFNLNGEQLNTITRKINKWKISRIKYIC